MSRRIVTVDDFMPLRNREPVRLQPQPAGTQDRRLARLVCTWIADTTPRLTYKGQRAVLRPLTD